MQLKQYMKELSPEQREVADQVVSMMESEFRDAAWGVIKGVQSHIYETTDIKESESVSYHVGIRNGITRLLMYTGLMKEGK